MDSLFYDMRDSANAVIFCRLTYDSTLMQVLTMCDGKKKFKPNKRETDLIQTYQSLRNEMPSQQKRIADHYFNLKREYDDSCKVNGIKNQYARICRNDIAFFGSMARFIGGHR